MALNSTKKGDELEARIFRLFQEEIHQDRFFLKKDCCKLFRKKGYYSKDREKHIIFDLSIEIFLPGQDFYSLLFLVECKSYNHPVPVDDAEEFYSKIQQISGANIKGVIASTNSFQEGTLNYARSKGIGLLRYYDSSDFKWVLNRSPSSLISNNYALSEWKNAYRGITNESHRSIYFDCYCCINNNYTNSLKLFFSSLSNINAADDGGDLLNAIVNPIVESSAIVAYRDETEIEDLSKKVLSIIDYQDGEVQLEDVCKWQAAEKGLRVTFDKSHDDDYTDTEILGRINFEPLEIEILENIHKNATHKKFTLAHELGHLLLGHGKYMTSEYYQKSDFELEILPNLGIKDIARMEWQANYLASCLLLPRDRFVHDFMRLSTMFGIRDRGFGLLYLDKQACNIAAFYNITGGLRSKYRVSRSVVKIRLKKLGLLNETELDMKRLSS